MIRALIVCAAALSLHAATPLYQTSIDTPQNYSVVRGIATLDAAMLHNGRKSLRVEPARGGRRRPLVRFSPVASPSASATNSAAGCAPKISKSATSTARRSPPARRSRMASMPFDVHSASLGGTQPWTRLSLQFIASRAQDQILLTRRQRRRIPRQGVVRRRQPGRSRRRRTRGPRAKPCRRSARRTAIRPPAGSICTSKASPTSAATSTAT